MTLRLKVEGLLPAYREILLRLSYNIMLNSQINKDLSLDGVLTLEFNAKGGDLNTFNNDMINCLTDIFKKSVADPAVKAILLYGGKNKSFCAGGDFNEVKDMKTGEEVGEWIDRIIGLYISVLAMPKPVIAAVDGYAIGLGFQLSLTVDMRIGTENTTFIMPELSKGIACTLGATMLQRAVGRVEMQKIVFGCREINYEESQQFGFLNQIVSTDKLFEQAYEAACALAKYPSTPMMCTKEVINTKFIKKLKEVSSQTKEAHIKSFLGGAADTHIKRILGNKYQPPKRDFSTLVARQNAFPTELESRYGAEHLLSMHKSSWQERAQIYREQQPFGNLIRNASKLARLFCK